MKKIFLYMVLGLLLSSNAYASNLTLSLRCHQLSWFLYSLDISNDENTYANVSEYHSYDGEKKPEMTLVITANQVDEGKNIWEGEVLFVDMNGKRTFRLTNITFENNLDVLHAVILEKSGNIETIRLNLNKTFNYRWGKTTNEEIYWDMKHIKTYNVDTLKKKNKKINMTNKWNNFMSTSKEYACFK